MGSCTTQSFKDLLERITKVVSEKEITKPDHPWDELSSLEANFDFSRSNLKAYKKQVLYNILHYSAWHTVEQRIKEFIAKTENLTTKNVVDYRLEIYIDNCHESLKYYIEALSARLTHADVLVERLFALQPNNVRRIKQDIESPAEGFSKHVDSVQSGDEIKAALSAALAAKKLHEQVGSAEDIIESAKKSMKDARSHRGLPEPEQISSLAKRACISAKTIKEEIKRAVLAIEGEIKTFWNKGEELELLYSSRGDEAGFLYHSEELYKWLIAKANAGCSEVLAEGKQIDVNSDNAVHLLGLVSDARRKVGKIENNFYVELAFWLCIFVIMGAVGCLAYYAYELHIKPIKLGMAVGFICLSIFGLLVRNWYQKKKVHNLLTRTLSSELSERLEADNPGANVIQMNAMLVQPPYSRDALRS